MPARHQDHAADPVSLELGALEELWGGSRRVLNQRPFVAQLADDDEAA